MHRSRGLFPCFLVLLGGIFVSTASAQLANPAAIPVGPNPPVIFLNGYQADCRSSTFAGTFGAFDKVMLAFGRQPIFFDNCMNTGIVKPSIEEIGNTFARFLGALRYADGSAVSRVDVVAHSMGGLILRSYLAGKQFDGSYTPPATVPIRKMVFLAVPNFGTPVSLGFAADQQLIELSVGSTFVFDLATWNQGIDDLRSVDAFAIAGNGGTGAATGIPRFDDGIVSLESASIGFARAKRTRILPYCHTGPGLVTAASLCPPNVRGIADVAGAGDIPAIMVSSFLADSADYTIYGQPADENEYLFSAGGLILRAKAADDSYPFISTATANGSKINVRTTQVAYSEYLFPRTQTISLSTTTNDTFMQDITITPGFVNARTIKKGPVISRVLPSATNVSPLMVGSSSYISIYGTGLDGALPFSNGVPLTVIASSPSQINAVLTADPSKTAVPITVSSPTGKATVTMLTLPNVPALFTQNASGSGPASALNAVTNALVTAAAPLKQGDYVSLYLTGLTFLTDPAAAPLTVSVTVAGKACPIQFAGVAPGYTVLDQINCQIPLGVPSSTTVPVIVTVNGVVSNTVTLAIQ